MNAEITRAKGVEATKLSLVHKSNPSANELKAANIVIVRLGRTGVGPTGSYVLYPNVNTLCCSALYDGNMQNVSGVVCTWNKSNGTVTLSSGSGNYWWNSIYDYYLLY